MSDGQELVVDLSTLERLATLLSQAKFANTPGTVSVGGGMVSVRELGEPIVNELVSRLLKELKSDPRKSVVLAAFADALVRFPKESDTEDREEFLSYFETIMDIVGLESSDGLLMSWLYGEHTASTLARPKC